MLKWSRLKKRKIVREHLQHKVTPLAPILINKKILYHGTDHKLNTRAMGPSVVTVHDMQPFIGKWLDPKFAQGRIDVMTHAMKSDVQRIIAVSHFTKSEIIKFFPEVAHKIDVVYHGYDFSVKTPAASPRGVSVNRIIEITKGRPFLFFLGNLEERKNLINQIKAFEILKEKHKDLLFILAGKPGFNFEEINQAISQSRFRADIHLTGYLSEEEKTYALTHTSCLMFVSWYEGFGIPVIEALANNTNIVISAAGSLGEIGNGYCYECAPDDPSDIASKTAMVMERGNPKKIELDSWKKEWSWERCALETIEVYKKAYHYM